MVPTSGVLHRSSRRGSRGWFPVLVVLAAGALGACSLDGLLKSNELPPTVTDPAITETPDGARAAYHGTLYGFQEIQGTVISTAGFLSDELSGSIESHRTEPVSLRRLEESPTPISSNVTNLYQKLNNVRQRSLQAIGLLGDYLPGEPALKAHLYAVQGYTEVLLAELFCSGIPLSSVDYRGDYTLRPGSSTAEVLAHAVALFDTALTLAGDSARIIELSRMGRGRAFLGLANYAAAAEAVAEVPNSFRYELRYTGTDSSRGIRVAGVQDREGINGLDYRTSGDPRTSTTLRSDGFYYPTKYHPDGRDTLVLASGIEARLVAAEAAFRADPNGSDWLAILNALRTDGTQSPASTVYDTLGVTGCGPDSAHWCSTDGVTGGYFQVPPGATLVSSVAINPMSPELQQYCIAMSYYAPCYETPGRTVVNVYDVPAGWNAGAGGVAGLEPLADPGTDAARIHMLFRERAFWLFLTGHRQGDMRRLVRQYKAYGFTQDKVYPVGTSLYSGETYGGYIDLPIPWEERTLNPLFTGCGPRD